MVEVASDQESRLAEMQHQILEGEISLSSIEELPSREAKQIRNSILMVLRTKIASTSENSEIDNWRRIMNELHSIIPQVETDTDPSLHSNHPAMNMGSFAEACRKMEG